MKLYYSLLIVVMALTGFMAINYLATSSEAAREFALVGTIIGTVMVLIERIAAWLRN